MSEPLLALLKRTQALLLAKAAQCLGGNSLDPLALDQAEGVARQLEDRADQCATWIFNLERWGGDAPAEHEALIRSSCESWLRMIR